MKRQLKGEREPTDNGVEGVQIQGKRGKQESGEGQKGKRGIGSKSVE